MICVYNVISCRVCMCEIGETHVIDTFVVDMMPFWDG